MMILITIITLITFKFYTFAHLKRRLNDLKKQIKVEALPSGKINLSTKFYVFFQKLKVRSSVKPFWSNFFIYPFVG